MLLSPSPPHDPHSAVRDLVAVIHSASSLADASTACASAVAFLRLHPPVDLCRPFFSSALPALLSRLLGLGELDSPAWIDLPDPSFSSLLLDLLSPSGPLLSLVDAADARSLLRFSFPLDRLPKWIASLFVDAAIDDPSNLCPLLKRRVELIEGTLQLHLSVFEYYFLWFASYPLLRGASASSNAAEVRVRRTGVFCIERWAARQSSKRREERRICSELYLRLLGAYLQAFVPQVRVGKCRPYMSSLLHYSIELEESSSISRAEFMLQTFICFWMVDNDFSPVPVYLSETSGVLFPMLKALGKLAPSAVLAEPVRLVINYLNGGFSTPADAKVDMERLGGHWQRGVSGSWNSLVQRPLYRFIARSFLFCPMGAPIENISQVFALWISYLAPWTMSSEHFTELKHTGVPIPNESPGCMYSPLWNDYVMSNFPFYSSLVVHFLIFANKFLHNNTESIIQMTVKVIDIVTSSKQLTDFLMKINDSSYWKQDRCSSIMIEGGHNFIPLINEQLQDWEEGLCACGEDTTVTPETWSCRMKPYGGNEHGTFHLLQLLIERARLEIGLLSEDSKAKTLQDIESLRAKLSNLCDISISSSQPPSPVNIHSHSCINAQDDVFTPKYPRLGKCGWTGVQYEGSSLRSPISENEVAWLAKCLIRLSDFFNELLSLNSNGGKNSTNSAFVKVPQVEQDIVAGAKGSVLMFLFMFGSWIALLFKIVLRFIREKGWRINLRILASKKVITLLFAYVAFRSLSQVFGR